MVTDYVITLITILIWRRPLMVAIASNRHQVMLKFLPEPEAWVSEVYD